MWVEQQFVTASVAHTTKGRLKPRFTPAMAPTQGGESSPSARCSALMAKQRGLITRMQAILAGLSERQIDHRLTTGMWRPAHPGVYTAIECSEDWKQRAMAACLWAGEGAAVSHRSAALLWRLDGIVTSLVEITTPRALRDPRVVIHRSRLLTAEQLTRVAGIPVTSPTRTLINLSAVVPPQRVEVALDDALRRGLTSIARLELEIGERAPGLAGVRTLRKTLEGYRRAPLESPLERRFLRLLRAEGLPEPEVQHEIYANGRLIARVDFAYPDLRLGIEVDGYRWHSGRVRWAKDLVLRNELTALRWRILHITEQDMSGRQLRAVEIVRRALNSSSNPTC